MARLVYDTSLGYHDSWFAAFLCLTIFNCSPPKLVRILESESRSWTVTSSDQTTTSVFRINRGHSTLHLYGLLIATRRARQTIYYTFRPKLPVRRAFGKQGEARTAGSVAT